MMKSTGFVLKVYVDENKDHQRRGRPLGRWKNEIKKLMCEKVVNRVEHLSKPENNVWIRRDGDCSGYSWRQQGFRDRWIGKQMNG